MVVLERPDYGRDSYKQQATMPSLHSVNLALIRQTYELNRRIELE
jgi:hypothetical protein